MSEAVSEPHTTAEADKSETDGSPAQDDTSAQRAAEGSKDDNDDVADINLKDPELEKVALKMQSKFRFKKK